MVKNTKGGSKNKKIARKNMVQDGPIKTRYADPNEPCEMYANVTKMYGQGNCEVMCNDGVRRMCVIRNKFRGRNKRQNNVSIDTKVLVGLRDWEVVREGKMEKCDLLEVYDRKQNDDIKNDPNSEWKYLCSQEEKLNIKQSEGYDFCYEMDEEENENDESENGLQNNDIDIDAI